MPNWCANRIQCVAPACQLDALEAWATGQSFPYYRWAIRQSIRLFLAGVAGRLKPVGAVHYAPYPALTAHGAGDDPVASRAFGEWLTLLQANAWLDEATCTAIDRCYQDCGLAALTWDALTADEQAAISGVMQQKRHGWGGAWLSPVSDAAMFDGMATEPEGEPFDLRMILPTRLACEINGFNGKLLTGVLSTYHFYTDYYGTKWPSDCNPAVVRESGGLRIDVDTAWSPPSEAVLAALSIRWGATVEHYYSEAGCDYCGYRRYESGGLTESIEDSLEYDDEEDEYGYCEVSGPSWLVGNVPHYGG